MSAGRSPGEGLDEDEEVDEEGEEEECDGGGMSAPIMDSTVSTATAALQARRGVGRPLRWMEHLKMERLKQVNGVLPKLGTLSPTLPPRCSTLPAILNKGNYSFL